MAMVSRPRRNRRSRRKNLAVNQPQPTNPVFITEASAQESVLLLTFDQAVTLQGTPGITVDEVPAATPVSATQTAPDRVVITYSASIDAGQVLTIPYRDPAIRGMSGGFVTGSKAML